MINKRLAILMLVIGLLGLVGVGTYVLWPKPPEAPSSITAYENPLISSEDTNINVSYLKNIQALASIYSSSEYIFINDSALDYARKNFPHVGQYELDEVSLEKRDNTSYQFFVRNADGTRLFYVIATRTPDNQISLGFYKS